MGNLSSFTNATVAPQIVATGTLAAGQTDFGTTLAFPVNQYPTQQVGAVLVYLDGQLLLRNVGNATAAPSADGNYQEVDAGNGFSILIRLNQADPLNARTYTIVSNGFTVAQPTSVYQSQIQTLQTQQDVMASTLADVAGVSTTAFYAVPNDTTRLTFTNRVTALETNSASKNASNTWTAPQSLPGQTNGAAVASGYIGQVISATATVATNSAGVAYSLCNTGVLTPGIYIIYGSATFVGAASLTAVLIGLNTAAANFTGTVIGQTQLIGIGAGAGAYSSLTLIPFYVNIATSQTYYLNAQCGGANNIDTRSAITAIRIA